MDGIVLYLIVAIVMGLYFLPSITAWMRGHPSKWAIIALNFLWGWTHHRLDWRANLVADWHKAINGVE